MMSKRTRTAFEKDLLELRTMILEMGARVDEALERAMEALDTTDVEKARRVIEGDELVNEQRFDVEEAALALIARQQPAAKDLREIISALSIVLDLERIGDYAAGIANTVVLLSDGDEIIPPPEGLWRIHDLGRSMLKEAMVAYERDDAVAAEKLAARDDVIDELYRALFKELLQVMAQEPEHTERALYLLFAGHNLERVADRVTNIAERVVFTKSGEMEELNVDLE